MCPVSPVCCARCVAVSIGIMYRREVIVGVVHAPVSSSTYYATVGGGSWLRSPFSPHPERLHVSRIDTLTRACVATEMGYDRSTEGVDLLLLKLRKLLLNQVQSVRMYGSCCLNMCQGIDFMPACLACAASVAMICNGIHGACIYTAVHCVVAQGKIDAYYEGTSNFKGPKPWSFSFQSLRCAAAIWLRPADLIGMGWLYVYGRVGM